MNIPRWVTSAPLLLAIATVMLWSYHAEAGEASSCVKCHLDEDMLTDSLAEVKARSSAMQSGAG